MHTDQVNASDHDTIAQLRSRTSGAPRPGDTSSPEAPAAPRHRRRRLGLMAGALVALFLLSGCNLPVAQWVPDFNHDGTIDDAEVAQQRTAIVNSFVGALTAQRQAIQNHPFLACVRRHESGGNYQAQNRSSSASGAYQFLDSTWRTTSARAGLAGYGRASSAPWYVQDAVALWLYSNGGRSAWNGTGC
jgi:hypothetical protein